MDIVTIILEGLRVILGFLLLLFIPGFAITLVYFPRLSDIGIVERLVYSTVLSIGSVIVLILFMDVFLGINTKPLNIFLVIVAFSCFAFVVWLCECWYLNRKAKNLPASRLSVYFRNLQRSGSRKISAILGRFGLNIRTTVRPVATTKRPEIPTSVEPKEVDQSEIHQEILRDLDTVAITPDSFGSSKEGIEHITIPKKSDVNKKLAEVKEEDQDGEWQIWE
jgi:hypothetical protein